MDRWSDFLSLKGFSKAPLMVTQLNYPPSWNTVFIMFIRCLPKLLLLLTSSLGAIWENVLGINKTMTGNMLASKPKLGRKQKPLPGILPDSRQSSVLPWALAAGFLRKCSISCIQNSTNTGSTRNMHNTRCTCMMVCRLESTKA